MDDHLKILRELSKDKTLSQRDLSKRLGLSLGKVNYVLNALIDKGLVKAKKFKNSKNKAAYMYILTPKGTAEKMELTYHFLKKKTHEYDALRREIEELKKDLKKGIRHGNHSKSYVDTKDGCEILDKQYLTD